jgi:hypothetical protein
MTALNTRHDVAYESNNLKVPQAFGLASLRGGADQTLMYAESTWSHEQKGGSINLIAIKS